MTTSTMPAAVAPVLERLDQDREAAVARLVELLRIPSISTDAAYAKQTRQAAEFCAADLASIGFDAAVRDTAGHPMVVARHEGPAGAPHVLYYGHYDVQPPDPVELWTSPPFEPSIVDGPHGKRVVARGAVDDKGQLMTFVEAFRAWKAVHGALPIGVTVLLEGEEESGSPSLDPFLEANREELAADVCVVCDTGMWDIDTPAITTMLRGLVYLEVTLRGASHDLHSGVYGGSALNAIDALCRLVASLHDADGRIAVPGFYDDVREVPAAQRAQWDALGFDEASFLGGCGLTQPMGEAGRSPLERLWSRPTCDVNGIVGGYTGAGAKTVIAAEARAKISFRLVPEQDPARIEAAVMRFLRDRAPADADLTFARHGASPAIRVPTDSPQLAAARRGLADVFPNEPVLVGCGGSIPVVGSIRTILGFDSLLIGFGLEDDRMHSPNEKFELRCFHDGAKAHAAVMARLGE